MAIFVDKEGALCFTYFYDITPFFLMFLMLRHRNLATSTIVSRVEIVATMSIINILLYIKRDDICIYIYIYIYICYHFTDTTASSLTRRSAKTVKDIIIKHF